MKARTSTIITLLLTLIPTLLSACTEDPVPQVCEMDPSTMPILYSWIEVDNRSKSCRDNAVTLYVNCKAEGGTNQECFEQQTEEERQCMHWEAMGVNKMPLRECEVAIWVDMGSCGDQGPSPDCSEWFVDPDSDYDKDGLTDFQEKWMGYNPCTEFSFGCESDAEYDYDADGIPNGEDPNPICNPGNDPGMYPSDCV